MSMTIILPASPLRVQLDQGIYSHNRYASLHRALQLLDLAHARFQYARLDLIHHLTFHQVQAVVLVIFLLDKRLLVFLRVSVLGTL